MFAEYKVDKPQPAIELQATAALQMHLPSGKVVEDKAIKA